MSMNAVKYEGEIKGTVDAYNALEKEVQSGDYWNKTDADIQKVKKHIKDHYKVVQDYTCVYCQQKIVVEHGMAWDIEHIIPKNPYPQFLFTEENLAVACKDCNRIKSDNNVLKNIKRKRFPKKSEDYIIVHPHFDVYDEHIKIITNQIYLPIDKKGTNTIEICGLLRFAYQFSNYGTTTIDLKRKMVELTQALQSTDNPIEENYILGCISDLSIHGQKISRESYLKQI